MVNSQQNLEGALLPPGTLESGIRSGPPWHRRTRQRFSQLVKSFADSKAGVLLVVVAEATCCIVPWWIYNPKVHSAGDHPFLAATAPAWRTTLFVLAGVALAAAVGYIGGVLFGLLPRWGPLGLFLFRVGGGVPVAVWIYVLMVPNLPLGLDQALFPITVVFVATSFPIAIAVFEAVRRIRNSDLVLHLRHLGARHRTLAKVLFLAALPTLLESAQVAILLAWSLAVLAEVSGTGQTGVGIEMKLLANMGSGTLALICFLGAYLTTLAALSSLFIQLLSRRANRFRIS
jgi:ABC-type nitrate/sulfonate/bicarbonate transport system permease component